MADSTLHCPDSDAPSPLAGHSAEHYYQQVFRGLPAAIYTTDANGFVTMFNDAAVKLWGRAPVLGEQMWCGSYRIFKPDGSPLPLDSCPMAVALREGRSVRGEEIVVERPDGSRRNVLPHPDPILDSRGRVVGAINMLVDITDTKTAQRERAHSEQRLRLATQTGKVGVWDWDIPANRVSWSESLYEIHGVSPNQFTGTVESFAELVHPDDKEKVSEAIRRSVRDGAPYDLEFRAVRPDGKVIWLYTNAAVLRDEGRPISMTGATMDITDRKTAEQALRDAEDSAEAASRAKDKFFAVLSHELRTPLTPVLMTVAAMEFDADLPRHMRDDIAMIRRNVELETKLIDDLLDLSRITSGKLRLRLQSMDVNQTVRHVCGICRDQILEKGIQLHCNLGENVARVYADPARLQQVLWNVLKNAAKFTPEGGEIRVRTSSADHGRVRIEIRDSGVGIDPEILPRIFDAFEQGDQRITAQFGGLGLGLAISKALVELHNGTIRAQSNGAGKGATFTIDLPPEKTMHDRPAVDSNGNDQHRSDGLRLLIVEDHVDTARTLGRLLQSHGYVVQTAGTVASAFDLTSSEHFDLVLTDIGLPDATGYELIQKIKSCVDRKPIKCIAMSGYGMDEDIRKSKDAGFHDHLVKPLTLEQLMQSIRKVLGETNGAAVTAPAEAR